MITGVNVMLSLQPWPFFGFLVSQSTTITWSHTFFWLLILDEMESSPFQLMYSTKKHMLTNI